MKKVLVTYASKTGNTKKLAEGIYDGLQDADKTILPMEEARDTKDYDVILAGYWVDKGGPCAEAKEYLGALSGKKVGLFCTLAFWPDSEHGYGAILAGEALVKEQNHVIGKFHCQGRIDPELIKVFEKMPDDNPHKPTPEKRKRYRISENHPSAEDIACAAQMFSERIAYDV
ncbi:MAG: flavodoxin [Lachnospiraceae bacterium]|nr:flavodoxin [Lachnospiraceae bacterium]